MLEKKSIEYEKTVLIGVINQQQNEEKVTEYLDELGRRYYIHKAMARQDESISTAMATDRRSMDLLHRAPTPHRPDPGFPVFPVYRLFFSIIG